MKDSRTSFITNRGYTGHEHLDAFGIINMNGRVYDPLTAMFFSPDPFVQAPGNWLNYNRYGYCMNNPTRYTDPSGYKFYNKESVWFAPYASDWMGYSGSGGGGSDRIFDWYSTFIKATSGGFIGGGSEFLNQYDKQFDTNTNGTMTFYYSINYFVGKSHFENGNYVLPELIPVGYSIDIKTGRNSNYGQNIQSSDNFNQTICDQFKAINTKYLSVTFNSDVMTKNDPSNKTTVTTNKRLKPISTTTGTLTVGEDGSITVGSTVFGGLNVTTGDYIFGINVPTGLNSSGGITTTANGALIRGIGVVAVGVGIICIAPEVALTITLAY